MATKIYESTIFEQCHIHESIRLWRLLRIESGSLQVAKYVPSCMLPLATVGRDCVTPQLAVCDYYDAKTETWVSVCGASKRQSEV